MTDSSYSDDSKVATPSAQSAPDAVRQRSRRRLIVGGAVVVAALLVGGGTWLATRGSGGDEPGQGAPVVPSEFAGYKEAKSGDTEWSQVAVVNTDISKGRVNLTYRASGGKALLIRAQYTPNVSLTPVTPGEELRSIYNSTIDQQLVKTYPAGAVGGKIHCADITIGKITFTTCGWHNNTTDVALAPVLNHHEVVSTEAASYLRAFINSLHITPSK